MGDGFVVEFVVIVCFDEYILLMGYLFIYDFLGVGWVSLFVSGFIGLLFGSVFVVGISGIFLGVVFVVVMFFFWIVS